MSKSFEARLQEATALGATDPTRGVELALEMLRDAERAGHIEHAIRARVTIGRLRLHAGETEAALPCLIAALERLNEVDGVSFRVDARISAGVAYAELGAFPECFEQFNIALAETPSDADHDLLHRLYGNLGYAYHRIGDYDESLRYVTICLEQSKTDPDETRRNRAHSNFHNVQTEKARRDYFEHPTEANYLHMLRCSEALLPHLQQIAVNNDSLMNKARAEHDLARIRLEQGSWNIARDHATRCLEYCLQVQNWEYAFACRVALALADLGDNRIVDAFGALANLLIQPASDEYHYITSDGWRFGSLLAERHGNFELAIHAVKQLIATERKFAVLNSRRRAQALSIRLDVALTRRESELLRRKNEELTSSNSELEIQTTRLTRQANEDALTGLGNRRYFDNGIQRALAISLENGSPLSVAMIDLDHFKSINDRLTHRVGDEVLQQIGQLLLQHARGGDLVARYGGEEFAIVFHDLSIERAEIACNRLRAAVEGFDWAATGVTPGVTISVGLCAAQPERTASDVVALADAALYDAKRNGRNCVRRADHSPD
jgi:diguanylate cyclase (GGDEF)-like protein